MTLAAPILWKIPQTQVSLERLEALKNQLDQRLTEIVGRFKDVRFATSLAAEDMAVTDGIAGLAGAPLELRAWQKKLLEHLYARDDAGGYVARTALIGMPRKNGKSALSSAAIALYSLIAEGVQGAEIIVAAAEKEQARIVFGEARRMVEASELAESVTLYRDSIYVPDTKSVLRVVSAEAYSKEA